MNDPTLFRKTVLVFDWNYEPVPPFVVQWFHESVSLGQVIVEERPTLEDAVALFFEIGLPQRIEWIGQIVDGTQRAVLIWDSSSKARHPSNMFGPGGLWMGVEAPFRVMDELEIAHPVDRAIWEIRAQEARW